MELSEEECFGKKHQRWQINFLRNKYVQNLRTRQTVYSSAEKRGREGRMKEDSVNCLYRNL